MVGADFSWTSRAWAGDDITSVSKSAELPAVNGTASGAASDLLAAKGAPAAAIDAADAAARRVSHESAVSLAEPYDAASGRYGPLLVSHASRDVSGSGAEPFDLHVARSASVPPPALAALTLLAPRFRIAPGALVGVCGAVGSGKSSLLAALLGELQPVPPPGWRPRAGAAVPGAPRVHGRMALCQQVPWIEAGSVRDNITFGLPFDAARCARVRRCRPLGTPHVCHHLLHHNFPCALAGRIRCAAPDNRGSTFQALLRCVKFPTLLSRYSYCLMSSLSRTLRLLSPLPDRVRKSKTATQQHSSPFIPSPCC